ncbi:hypothetical protein [Pseudoduganella plicata]|uniref:ABC transporter permease n=1 Tax=Pseudoduganella plicata TaxID=321984 RepID=A0ABX5S7M5_9BURK|nr:hypothetical protein [Pseudoduganella plicata]QBQ35605.1 hypothetical protein E1742_05055 [Pseudoduganella plicata]
MLAWRLQGTWGTWALLAGAVLSFCGFGIGMRDWRAGVVAAGVFLGTLVIAWWLQLLNSALRQNEPALACLVPHQRRRIVTVVGLAWLGGSLAIGIVFGIGLNHIGYAWLAAAATMMYMAVLQRLPILTLAPLAILVATRFVPLPSVWSFFTEWGETGISSVGLLMLLMLAPPLARLLFPRGGDGHMAWHRQFVDRVKAAREGLGLPGQELTLWRSSSWTDRLYFADLRRLSERTALAPRRNGRADPLLMALGGSVHPGASLLGIAAITVLAFATGGNLLDYMGRQGSVVQLCLLMLVLPLAAHVYAVTTAVQRFRAEQALLRLCPAAPATADFNRQFGSALLRRFAVLWLASTAAAVLVAAIMIPGVQAQASVGVTAALALLLAAFVVRDFASIRRLPNVTSVAAIVAVIVLTVVLSGGMTLWRTHVPWLPIGCLALAAIGLIYYRWRRMQSLPVAFPAGRLATD